MKGQTTRFGTALLIAAVGWGCGGGTGAEETGAKESTEPATVEVPAGTEIVARLAETLSTRTHVKGDSFTATVDSASGGLPAGAVIHGVVAGAQTAKEEGQKGVLALAFRRVDVRGRSPAISARVLETAPEVRSTSSTGEDAAKVGGAAAAGAVLGRVIGGDGTGAAVGAAVGAAAGTGVVLATKDGYAVLPKGSRIRLELTAPVTIPAPEEKETP